MSLQRFIELWTHPDYPPDSVEPGALDSLESRLQTYLPIDYRAAILEFGLPRPTIELLDAIVKHELNLADASEFHGPVEIATITEGWREAGLPGDLIAFASDCTGNLFCFLASESRQREQPVLFWDHDFDTVDEVAPSFAQWIECYCDLPG